MKRFVLVLMILMFAGCFISPAFAAPERIPFTISDNFETGEMYGWETYPYAQDIGYEPFTTCMRKPTHNKSKFALGKIQRPNDIVELSEGFTKEIDLWTAANTRMKLALFLVSDRNPETVEFSLCLFDGRRYFYTLKSPDSDQWLELDNPVKNFAMNGKSLESGQHVQAVTIKANYRIVSHMLSYTILMDDFSLNGERPRRFHTQNPSSTTFEHFGFSILNKHFFYGDAFGITVKPEEATAEAPAAGTGEVLAGLSAVEPLQLIEEAGAEMPVEEKAAVPAEEALIPPPIIFEPATTEEKPKLRFAEDIMAPKPAKAAVKPSKAKKKKKGAYGKESTEDSVKAKKGRRDFTVEEDEEYY